MTPAQRALLASQAAGSAVADRWAQRLGLSVRIVVAGANAAEPDLADRLPSGVAWFETPSGRLGLMCPAHLVTALVPALLGASARSLGPVGLSDTELGLFGYLALETVGALPGLSAALVGFDRATVLPFDRDDATFVPWRVEVDGRPARLLWGTARRRRSAAVVPIPLRIIGPWPDQMPLRAGRRFVLAELPCEALTGNGPLLRLAARPSLDAPESLQFVMETTPKDTSVHTPPESLPCTLSLDLGSVVLSAGAVAALQPGDPLPVTVRLPTEVWIRAGDVLVAEARLVPSASGLTVEIVRVLLPDD